MTRLLAATPFLLGAACALLSAALAPTASAHAPNAARDNPKKALAEYMTSCEALGWSGVVLVRRQGKIVYFEAHGPADRGSGRELKKSSRFEIASMTKPFTAAAVMSLVDEGKVDLDASIAEYLPGVPDHAKGITVSHLLSHESGMPGSAMDGRGDDLAKATADYLRQPPLHKPGTRDEYWNGGYALLAGIVESVDGRPFEESMRARVFGPAKMKSSGFIGDDIPEQDQARGHAVGKPSRLASEPPYGSTGWHYRGMGGLVTDAEDILKFIDALDGGRIVKPATAKLMQTRANAHFGLGWGLAYSKDTGSRRGHGGDVRGFHVYLTSLLEKKVDVIVLSNFGPLETYKVTWNLEALALGLKLPYPAPPTRAVWKATDLKALAGTWASDEGSTLKVESTPSGIAVSQSRGGAVESDPHAVLMTEFIAALEAKNLDAVRSSATTKFPSWPARLVNNIWPAHVARHGELLKFIPFAVHDRGRGFVDVRYELKHAKGSVFGYATIENRRIGGFVLDQTDDVFAASKGYTTQGASSATVTSWMPVGDDELARYDWGLGEEAGRMKLNAKPRKATEIALDGETFKRAKAKK